MTKCFAKFKALFDDDDDDSDIKDSGGNDDVAVRGHLERCKKGLHRTSNIFVLASSILRAGDIQYPAQCKIPANNPRKRSQVQK